MDSQIKIHNAELLIMDCYGTILLNNKPIEGIREFLEHQREHSKTTVILDDRDLVMMNERLNKLNLRKFFDSIHGKERIIYFPGEINGNKHPLYIKDLKTIADYYRKNFNKTVLIGTNMSYMNRISSEIYNIPFVNIPRQDFDFRTLLYEGDDISQKTA